MPDTSEMSDDFVASLLAKDAKDSSIKYSALGMEAFLPKKYSSLTFPCCITRADMAKDNRRTSLNPTLDSYEILYEKLTVTMRHYSPERQRMRKQDCESLRTQMPLRPMDSA